MKMYIYIYIYIKHKIELNKLMTCSKLNEFFDNFNNILEKIKCITLNVIQFVGLT